MAGPRARGGGSGPSGRGGPGEPFRLLFICTGNTCRSPLAEAIAGRRLRELAWEHVEVRSAGSAAATGEPASAGSLRAGERHGLDLSRHRSASLTPDLVEWADVVLTMSANHLPAVWALGGTGKASLVTDFAAGREAGGEPGTGGVADPMGGDDEEYEATFQELEALVTAVLERLAPLVAP